MNLVIDASVAVKWYVPEIYEEESGKVLSCGKSLHAPELILPEFCNIIWKKVRTGSLSSESGRRIVSAFSRVNVRIHPHQKLLQAAFTGATLTNQTVYDWSYLALAISLSCEFITADEKFYNALKDTQLGPHLLWIGDFS